MSSSRRFKSDWHCKICDLMIFGSKDKCFKCGTFKSKCANSRLNFGIDDWKCSCGETNFRKRDKCRKCEKSKSELNGINVVRNPNENLSIEQQNKPIEQQNKPPIRQGDWKCLCNELNFSYRSICRGCNRQRNGELSPASKMENLKLAEKEDDDNDVCVVCMEAKTTHAISKCGHLCYCAKCCLLSNKCAICRAEYNPATDVMRIYSV